MEKGISFSVMPDCKGQFPAWPQDSQYFANCVNRRWKEHRAEAADSGIERGGGERQMVGQADIKLRIAETKTACFPPRGFDHVRNRIDPADSAFGADESRDCQCRFSRAGGNIENSLSVANHRIFRKSRCDRRKHVPDHFAMLLPKRRRNIPSVEYSLLRLHEQKVYRPAPF